MALAPSLVAQSHCGARSKSGRCVNTTMGASEGSGFKSESNQSIWASPMAACGSETLSITAK